MALASCAVYRVDEKTRDIPVVMVAGLSDHDLKRKALELGATDLLTKPVDSEELLARISSVLQLKAYQDEIKSQNKVLEQKVYDALFSERPYKTV